MNSVLRAALLALALLAAPLCSEAQIGDGNDPSEFREGICCFSRKEANGIDWIEKSKGEISKARRDEKKRAKNSGGRRRLTPHPKKP